MLFEHPYFKVLSEEKYYKFQFKDGFNDKTIRDFQILSLSPAYKDEFKIDGSEKEFIESYIKAAEILAENCRIKNPAIKQIVFDYSLAIPCIFCCRQAIELVIKRCLNNYKVSYKRNHKINDLWNLLKKKLEEQDINDKDQTVLNDMDSFIKIICFFDNDNSTKLRYPDAEEGVQEQEKLCLVNTNLIVITSRGFVKHLLVINPNDDEVK